MADFFEQEKRQRRVLLIPGKILIPWKIQMVILILALDAGGPETNDESENEAEAEASREKETKDEKEDKGEVVEDEDETESDK